MLRVPLRLSSFACPVLPVLFWLSPSGCPVLAVTFYNSCQVQAVLFWLSQSDYPMAVFLWLPCTSYHGAFSGHPVHAVLFWLFSPGRPLLVVLSCSPIQAILSWRSCPVLFCPNCLVLLFLFSLSWITSPVLAVPFWLSRSGCPLQAVLFWLSCPGCSVLPDRSRHSCFIILWQRHLVFLRSTVCTIIM